MLGLAVAVANRLIANAAALGQTELPFRDTTPLAKVLQLEKPEGACPQHTYVKAYLLAERAACERGQWLAYHASSLL